MAAGRRLSETISISGGSVLDELDGIIDNLDAAGHREEAARLRAAWGQVRDALNAAEKRLTAEGGA